MNRATILLALPILFAASGCGEHARATPPIAPKPTPAQHAPSFAEAVGPALLTYCIACHDAATAPGGVDLDGAEGNRDPTLWGRVADAIRGGTMPPAGEPSPDAATRAAILDWVDAEVFRCGNAAAPGRVTLRRLNRAQYNNTVRDLIGVDVRPADTFPADDLGYGFDNNGDVLSMSPILMEKYLDAADAAIEAARRPDLWARLMAPPPDAVPPTFRQKTPPARSDPVKRIGVPVPVAPVVVDPETALLARAYDILRAFADRAYRRPATDAELSRLVGLVESARKGGDSTDEAIAQALRAVLVAPRFLFLVEEDPTEVAHAVDDFELAARLSYFLWNSMPDDRLARLAARGELGRGDTASAEARRMLADPRSGALVDGFAFQWLQLRGLADAALPGLDEPLRLSMLGETARLCAAIFRGDRPVFDFLDADYTFVDSRLARHYGIAGVEGVGFRRVSLKGGPRRGILTHASVLAATSSPTRTSPVRRGKWVLDCLLGTPPPPPPADAEGLGEQAGASSTTVRARMERHRADARCASCHALMDPIGFGLENFDALGGWRTVDGGTPVDASGTLPGGSTFDGPSGLHRYLSTRREAFARCLAEKLMTYALGRGPTPEDRCTIDDIARRLDREDARFSTLVTAIVEDPAFRRRAASLGEGR